MRIAGLDVLRTVAVLLVIIRHSELENTYVHTFGWLGVDLFFAISGFLVSGLLFAEYKKRGQLNIRRFLIRRGFKIYPPFYFFLLVNILLNDKLPDWARLWPELLYLQNYFQGIFTHSWSLAVEEHFYLALAFILFLLMHFKLFRPNKKYIIYLGILFFAQFLLRFILNFTIKDESFSLLKTHLRADGIIIGVLVSYLYHFTQITGTVHRYRILLIPLSLLLMMPGFLWNGSEYRMIAYGLSLVNLGFGLLVLLVAARHQVKPIENKFVSLAGFIGIHSYSIYLWHMFPNYYILKFFHYNVYIMTGIYIACAILTGILFSVTIEKVFLNMRDTKRVKKWTGEMNRTNMQ